MSNQYKSALDALVSVDSGVSKKLTSRTTSALYNVLLEQLSLTGEVTIPGLGTLRVYTCRVNRDVSLPQGKKRTRLHVRNQVRIYFSKAPRLKKALKEQGHGEVRSKRVGR